MPHNQDRLHFVTPELISKDENRKHSDMLRVIAIDEAHIIFYQRQEFRHAYKDLEISVSTHSFDYISWLPLLLLLLSTVYAI